MASELASPYDRRRWNATGTDNDQWQQIIKTPTILVFVGDTHEEFHVHEHVLKQSAFFAAELKAQWMNNESRNVQLDESSPSAFGHYVQWLYSGTFPRLNYDAEHENERILAEAYVLGDYLGHPIFQDSVMDWAVFTYRCGGFTWGLGPFAEIIYNGTAPSELDQNGPRKFVNDLYLHRVFVNGAGYEFIKGEYPAAFREDLTSRLLQYLVRYPATTSELKYLECPDVINQEHPLEYWQGLWERSLDHLDQDCRCAGRGFKSLKVLDGDVHSVPCTYHLHGKGEACGSTTNAHWAEAMEDAKKNWV